MQRWSRRQFAAGCVGALALVAGCSNLPRSDESTPAPPSLGKLLVENATSTAYSMAVAVSLEDDVVWEGTADLPADAPLRVVYEPGPDLASRTGEWVVRGELVEQGDAATFSLNRIGQAGTYDVYLSIRDGPDIHPLVDVLSAETTAR